MGERFNLDAEIERTAAFQRALEEEEQAERVSVSDPVFACPDILWQGHYAEIANLLGIRDWRVWLGITGALSARAHRNLHCNYYADLFGMGYWLMVAGSGTGKSLVTRLCSALLPPTYRKKYSVESGQGLINLMAESEKDEKGRTIALKTVPTVLLLSEWSALLSNMDIRGSSLMEKLNETYDSEHAIEANRTEKQGQNDSVSVTDPMLTLVGSTTVRTFRKRVKETHKETGLINRHFIVPGPSIQWKFESEAEYFPKTELEHYGMFSLPQAHTFGNGEVMRSLYERMAWEMSKSYGESFLEPLHANDVDEEEYSPYRRLHAYFRRIPALYAWSEGEKKIQPRHVEAGIAAVDTSLKFLRWLLGESTVELPAWQKAQSEIEEKIVRAIKEKPGVRRDDLLQNLKKNGGYTAVAERLEKLIKSGALIVRTENRKRALYLAS